MYVRRIVVAALAALAAPSALAALGGSAGVVIPYAGKLEQNGALSTGTFDFSFDIMPDGTTSTPCETKIVSGVAVTNGELALNITGISESCVRGKDVFLIVGVRPAGGGAFTTLGKQRVSPTLSALTSGVGDFDAGANIHGATANINGAVSTGNLSISGSASASGTVSGGNLQVNNGGQLLLKDATFGDTWRVRSNRQVAGHVSRLVFAEFDAVDQDDVSFDGDLGGGTSIRARAAITANATPDIAETIPAAKDVEAADVVCADPAHAERAVRCAHDARGVLGVISDGTSSFMINSRSHDINAPLTGAPLVLAGRVPVKVSLENGPIHIGDELTPSSTPGVAMRANGPGPVVGIALSDTTTAGTVLCLVKVSEASAAQLAKRVATLEALRTADAAESAKHIADLERRLSALEPPAQQASLLTK